MAATRPSLLVVEDDRHLAEQLRWSLQDGYDVAHADSRDAALEMLRRTPPDLVLLDLCLPPGGVPEEGFRVLEAARAQGVVAVVMSALEEREAALSAVERGAYDFFSKPLDLAALRVVVARALERQALERENRMLREQLSDRFALDGLVGTSPAMQAVGQAIRRAAGSPVTVILEGESGTGKGLVARLLHHHGSRGSGPFVAVHCAALPETLLEAELFGHERGAFTGAVGTRIGRFEAAHGGTLFLDEIATLTPAMQVKLLRVLEEREVERLGSNRAHPVDFRLIVATNEDLGQRVRRGELREDFYFRIRVFPIALPPLRERPTDIPLLAEHFLARISREHGSARKRLAPDAVHLLAGYGWPGNVRELAHTMETLTVLVDASEIGAGDVARVCTGGPVGSVPAAGPVDFKVAVAGFERGLLVDTIRRAGGVKATAARELGLDPGQMKYLSRKYGL